MTMRGAVLTFYLMAFTAHALGLEIDGDLSESELKVVNGNGRFANGIYKSLAHKEGNILFSPISAHSCLSMLYQGTGGSTKEACAAGLQVPEPDTAAEGYSKLIHRLNGAERLTVAIANKVYVSHKYHLKNEFKNAVEEKFKSEVESVDFSDADAAVNKINSWVKEKTKEKIPELLEKVDVTSSTSVILLNAVYFRGTWAHKFYKGNTKTEKFHIDENAVDVQMMHMQGNFFNYKDDKDLDAQILELPYTNTEYSMLIVLPKRKNGLADLEAKLVQKDLSKILEGASNKEPRISLPKFKIEHSMNLEGPLTEIGLGEIFGGSCDLSGMLEETNVQVNKVIQKAFIEVDEIGSTAAAATALLTTFGAVHVPEEDKPYFVADNPFVFLLVHKPNRQLDALNVLFYGRVQKPNL